MFGGDEGSVDLDPVFQDFFGQIFYGEFIRRVKTFYIPGSIKGVESVSPNRFVCRSIENDKMFAFEIIGVELQLRIDRRSGCIRSHLDIENLMPQSQSRGNFRRIFRNSYLILALNRRRKAGRLMIDTIQSIDCASCICGHTFL